MAEGTRLSTKEVLLNKFNEIGKSLKSRYQERGDFIDALLLATASGCDFFALGTPGTAKSTIIKDFLENHFDGNVFTATLDKNTVSSRLVGNVHPKLYMETGKEEHQTEGMIVEADLAFIDEVFKGARGCRECLLDILADRTWKECGVEKKIPLLALYSASNELPTSNEDAAFYSRLQVRVFVNDLEDGEVIREALWGVRPEPIDAVLTREDILKVREMISNIQFSEATQDCIIRDLLPELQDMKISTDQRKREKAFGNRCSLVQTKAFLNDSNTVEPDHLKVAKFVLPQSPRDYEDIRQVLLSHCVPENAEVQDCFNSLAEKAMGFIQLPENVLGSELIQIIKEFKRLDKEKLEETDRGRMLGIQKKLAELYLQKTKG